MILALTSGLRVPHSFLIVVRTGVVGEIRYSTVVGGEMHFVLVIVLLLGFQKYLAGI